MCLGGACLPPPTCHTYTCLLLFWCAVPLEVPPHSCSPYSLFTDPTYQTYSSVQLEGGRRRRNYLGREEGEWWVFYLVCLPLNYQIELFCHSTILCCHPSPPSFTISLLYYLPLRKGYPVVIPLLPGRVFPLVPTSCLPLASPLMGKMMPATACLYWKRYMMDELHSCLTGRICPPFSMPTFCSDVCLPILLLLLTVGRRRKNLPAFDALMPAMEAVLLPFIVGATWVMCYLPMYCHLFQPLLPYACAYRACATPPTF